MILHGRRKMVGIEAEGAEELGRERAVARDDVHGLQW